MSVSVTKKALVDNQEVSSKPNKKISRDIDHLIHIAEEDNQTDLLPELDSKLLFYCECSDEKCKERMRLRKSTYDGFHKNSRTFVIKPGHEIPAIERTVHTTKEYIVVEKYTQPTKGVTKFNKTNLHHSQKVA